MSLVRLVLALALVIVAVARVDAETVLVTIDGGEGHGWVFGSTGRYPGGCWLAFPAHLVRDGPDSPIRSWSVQLPDGSGAEGGPIRFATGVDAKGEPLDLAFSRLTVSRSCLSRLGLPPLAYEIAVGRGVDVVVQSRVRSSIGVFRATVVRANGSGAVERRVLLRPRQSGDATTFLKQGISGATALIERDGNLLPFAMVTNVTQDQKEMVALRFDTIRQEFAKIEAADAAGETADAERQPESHGPAFRVIGFEGLALNGTGPAEAFAEGRCWAVSPREGERQIAIVIEPLATDARLERISVLQAQGCGTAGLPVRIDQKPARIDSWTRLSDCLTTATSAAQSGCRLGLSGERQYRIRIDVQGRTGVSGLSLK